MLLVAIGTGQSTTFGRFIPMASDVVSQIIVRMAKDPAFRAQLSQGNTAAIAGYALSADERGALLGGDPNHITALGVDIRATKFYPR
jgi:hypothetical protein